MFWGGLGRFAFLLTQPLVGCAGSECLRGETSKAFTPELQPLGFSLVRVPGRNGCFLLVHAAPKHLSLVHAIALPSTTPAKPRSGARGSCNLNRTRMTNKTGACLLQREGCGGDG